MLVLRTAFIIASIIALSGCANKIEQAKKELNSDIQLCKQINGPPTRDNIISIEDCICDARLKRASQANYAYMDIIFELNSANRDAANKFAKGKIDLEELRSIADKNQANARREERMAQQNQQLVNAQTTAANAANAAAWQPMIVQGLQMTQPPQNQNHFVTCNNVGGTTFCNGN